MNSIEQMIVDLVRVAEAPVYSTYRWLGRQLGRDVQLAEFLRIINALTSANVLRLWIVDVSTGDRRQLAEMPLDLESRYLGQGHSDARYDPVGLSLTLGDNVEVDAEPDWAANLDFERGTFELVLRGPSESDVLQLLGRLYPDLRASVTFRKEENGGLRLLGVLREGNE